MSDFTAHEQERLRRVLGALADTAPLAPDLQPVRTVLRHRSKSVWAATAFAVTIAVIGGAIVLTRGDDSTPAVQSVTTTTTSVPATTTTVAGIDDEVSDEELIRQAGTWSSMLGLAQSDPVVWRERLERACTEGVWDRQVATQLAEEFIDQDLTVSVRAPGSGPPSVQDGAQALWIMAVNVCRDAFPAGEIEKGPPEAASSTTTTVADHGLRVIVQPNSAGEMPSDVELGCSSGSTFPASALNSVRPLEGSGLDTVEAAARVFLDNAEGQFWPQDGWQILHQTEGSVLLVHLELTDEAGVALDESRVAFMTVELVDGDWRWAGSSSGGPCPLRTSLPEGLNTVNWRIDPSAEPLTSNSTQIEVLVTERECVSGQAMGDRLLGPEVVITESAVLIAFAANPPPGGFQDCPGNPEQAVVVELSESLGNREVLDGLAVAGDLEDFLN